MANRTLQVNGQDFIINRDKKAEVTQFKVGELLDNRSINTTSTTEYTVSKTDDRNFTIDAANPSVAKLLTISPQPDFVGKMLITFDLTLNSGSLVQMG